MNAVPFYKMTAGGNDFLLFDNRSGRMPDGTAWISAACRRGLGAGADGAIYVEYSRKAHFRMRYFNADGEEAEFCGNGLQCAARFALLKVIAPRSMRIETKRGVREAEVCESEVRVKLAAPRGERLNLSLLLKGRGVTGNYLEAEVPHFVVFVEDLEACAVEELGRLIRHHPEFGPAGTNATFVQVEDEHRLQLRTYERGVEAETLACGTGSAAAAWTAARLGLCAFPAVCLTRGGGSLTIDSPSEGGSLWLSGKARMVYAGELWDEIFDSSKKEKPL
jgi:diaminopimelate epimerase